MPWSKSVFSSRVSEVSYDEETKELTIRWSKGGKVSIYSDVPEGLAEELSKAPSVGSMLNSDIITFYSHRYG